MADEVTAARHYEGQDLEALADIPRYVDWLLKPFRPLLRGRVLEIGAGIGNVSARYAGEARELVLVEPAQNLFERLRARFACQAHVRTLGGTLEDIEGELAPASFDAALLVNVLEHVDDDVAMLRRLHGLLRPGGALLLYVPALPILYGTLDALVHHRRRYTKSSLRDAVVDAGFDPRELRYCDVLGVIPWFLAGRVLKRPRFDEKAAQLYHRFFVPVSAGLEQMHEPPFGKNLFCIAEPVRRGV